MAQSPTLRYFNINNGFKEKENISQDPSSITPNQPAAAADNVQGWLMNIQSYRKEDAGKVIVDADNNSIPTENIRKNRNGRPESIASEDSVNLDELINANFTADMDDETDLPDLADLDLDDSTDDFWKLDTNDAGFDEFLSKSVDLDWSPATDTNTATTPATTSPTTPIHHKHISPPPMKSHLPVTPSSEFASRYKKSRSDSIGSENSLTSQSTVTQYAKYGLTPMIYPSESSSTSSRSLSRLSNYSTASSSTTSGIPHPRTNSNSNTNSAGGGIPTPSRSYTTRDANNSKSHLTPPTSNSQQRTKLAKRASHIPAPASYNSPPSPQRTISSSSAKNNPPKTTATKRIPQQRASHIPTVRESIHRPGSPLNNHVVNNNSSGRSSATPSRIGMRSPTPGNGPRNSLFGNHSISNNSSTQKETTTARSTTPTTENKRVMNPTANRPSNLRPPGSVASSVRTSTISRIGTVKKS